MWSNLTLNDLIGRTVICATKYGSDLYIKTDRGSFRLAPYGDCCAQCWIENVESSWAFDLGWQHRGNVSEDDALRPSPGASTAPGLVRCWRCKHDVREETTVCNAGIGTQCADSKACRGRWYGPHPSPGASTSCTQQDGYGNVCECCTRAKRSGSAQPEPDFKARATSFLSDYLPAGMRSGDAIRVSDVDELTTMLQQAFDEGRRSSAAPNEHADCKRCGAHFPHEVATHLCIGCYFVAKTRDLSNGVDWTPGDDRELLSKAVPSSGDARAEKRASAFVKAMEATDILPGGTYKLAFITALRLVFGQVYDEARREGHTDALEACERICREVANEYARPGRTSKESAALECADQIASFAAQFTSATQGDAPKEGT